MECEQSKRRYTPMTTPLSERQQHLFEQLVHLQPLDTLVPPTLEEAIGYYSSTFMGTLPLMRFVGWYWERCGDEVVFDDGATSATGNWQPFLLYTGHQRIAP